MGRDHDAGYGKPPRHSRFKKGQSGNPKGRPRGSRNFSTDLKATLEEPTRVTHHGKAQTVSTQHAALMRLREKALGGEVRALDSLIGLRPALQRRRRDGRSGHQAERGRRRDP